MKAKNIETGNLYKMFGEQTQDSGTVDQFTVKVADTMEDAIKLMEVGFEFHAEVEGRHKLFRKEKVTQWIIPKVHVILMV